jgi:hypothetical protein
MLIIAPHEANLRRTPTALVKCTGTCGSKLSESEPRTPLINEAQHILFSALSQALCPDISGQRQ